jgi:hypothetical protein
MGSKETTEEIWMLLQIYEKSEWKIDKEKSKVANYAKGRLDELLGK